MRLRLAPASRRLPWPWWATVIVVLWAGLAVAAGHLACWTGQEATLCPLKRFTGIPCPTCGTGRGGLCLLRGDLAGGWLHNPLVFSLAALAAVVLGIRLVLGRKPDLRLTRTERALAWTVAAALVLCNWAYVIRYVG